MEINQRQRTNYTAFVQEKDERIFNVLTGG